MFLLLIREDRETSFIRIENRAAGRHRRASSLADRRSLIRALWSLKIGCEGAVRTCASQKQTKFLSLQGQVQLNDQTAIRCVDSLYGPSMHANNSLRDR